MRVRSLRSSLKVTGTAAIALAFAGIFAQSLLADEAARIDTVAPVLWQQSMNVFRRHEVEAEQMYRFYGDVLGLSQLETFDVGDNTNVDRFMAGDSEVKFTHRVADRSYVPGGIEDATGLRLLTFFYPDRDAVIERFRANAHPVPEFRAVPGTTRLTALVTDPDGHAVELVVAPNEPESVYASIEVGLTVSDLDKARDFYANFVGLTELPEVQDRWSGTKKVSYQHGTTMVSLHQVEGDLPADTGTGGIQYVVSNVDAVDRLARARGETVDQPLSRLQGFDLRTIWLSDPDGITNYFAETGLSRGASAGAARQ
jgi:catechol 2,3-dioxygenase-like lactoylglutathione lyase family enzyme